MELDPVAPTHRINGRKVEDERFLLSIANLSLTLAQNANLPERADWTEEEQEVYNDTFNYLTETLDEKQERYEDQRARFQESEVLRRVRKDALVMPDDLEGNNRIPMKDLIESVGKVDENNTNDIKAFFRRLFQYGQNHDFSYNNYKIALSTCLQGKLYEEFIAMEEDEFPAIANWFYNVYNRPQELTDLEQKLRNFERKASEPIDVFMDRYIIPCKQADALMPEEHKHYSRDSNKLKVLRAAMLEPARKEFLMWLRNQFDGGLSYTYEDSLNKCWYLERYHQCLPKQPYIVSVDGQSLLEPVNSNVEEGDEEAHPAMRTGRTNRSTDPYPVRNNNNKAADNNFPLPVDPNRSFSNRTSFYNNKANKNKSNYNATNKSSFKRNNRNRDRQRGRSGANRSRGANNGNRGKRGNNSKWFVTPPQNSGNNNNNNSNYNNNPNNSSNYRQKNFPRQDNSQRGRGNSRGNNSNRGRGRSSRGGYNSRSQLRQGWFCLRCGIYDGDMEKTKRLGSTHTTDYCPIYPTWSNEFCKFCLRYGIKANHWGADCRLCPPGGQAASIEPTPGTSQN